MPAKMTLAPTIHSEKIRTVNLGTTTNKFGANDLGKAVKLVSADTYDLCDAGDKIEGIVTSSELAMTGATRGGLSVGGIVCSGYVEVVSAAVLAVNDFVVAAAQPTYGTAVTGIGEGDIPATPVQKAVTPNDTAPFLMRIVGLGRVGTGAAGTVCIAEFVN